MLWTTNADISMHIIRAFISSSLKKKCESVLAIPGKYKPAGCDEYAIKNALNVQKQVF
jgi:hypothetical protein